MISIFHLIHTIDLDSEQYNSVTTMQNTIRDRSQEYFAHEKEGTESRIRLVLLLTPC